MIREMILSNALCSWFDANTSVILNFLNFYIYGFVASLDSTFEQALEAQAMPLFLLLIFLHLLTICRPVGYFSETVKEHLRH